MKTYEFKIKIEGLQSSKVSCIEHDGSLDAENMESASQEAIQLAQKLNGEFTKCTLTLEQK